MQPALRRLLPVTILTVGGFLVEVSLWGGRTGLRWGGAVASNPLVLVCVCGLAGPLLTRIRPTLGFLLTVAISLTLNLAVPEWESFTGLLIALFLIARMESTAIAVAGLVLAVLPLAAIAWNSAGWAGPVTMPSFLPLLILWLLLALAVWGAGRAVRRSKQRIVNLEQSLLETERTARGAERRAIARDLHDIVGHSVAAIQLQAGGAFALMETQRDDPTSSDARVSTALGNIEDLSHQAMRELHRLLVTMRTEDAVGTAPQEQPLGGMSDVNSLLVSTRDSGIDVEVHETGEQSVLDPSIELAAYRFLQECLTNAMKHAGAGSHMRVDIVWGTDLVIDALSTGVPGSPPHSRVSKDSTSLGLVGLSERLASVGGTLTTKTSQDGFRTTARIPLDA